MLKTAHDAEEFMRTGARVSPSWPGGDLRGRIRCSRLISRRSRQNPLQTGPPIRFNTIDVKRSFGMLSLWSSTWDSIHRRLGELVRVGTYATAKLLGEPIKVVEARPVVLLAEPRRPDAASPARLAVGAQRAPAIWRFRSGNC